MSRISRIALSLIIVGGGMTSLANVLNRMDIMHDFWVGFITGMSIVLILWGVVLLIKEQGQKNKD